MNLDQIRYVLETAKCGSISKAAEQLFISQPSLSAALKQLETELAVTLFNRGPKGISLTPIGEAFIESSEQILEHIYFLEHLYTLQESQQEFVQLKIADNCYYPFNSEVLAQFNPGPKYSIQIHSIELVQLIEKMNTEQYHLGLFSFTNEEQGLVETKLKQHNLHFEPITQIPLCCIVGKNSPLFHLEQVSLVDCLPYTLITYNLAKWSKHLKRFRKYQPINAIEISPSTEFLLSLIQKTKAFTIGVPLELPPNHLIYHEDLRFIPFEEQLTLNTGFLIPKNEPSNPLIDQFMNIYRQTLLESLQTKKDSN